MRTVSRKARASATAIVVVMVVAVLGVVLALGGLHAENGAGDAGPPGDAPDAVPTGPTVAGPPEDGGSAGTPPYTLRYGDDPQLDGLLDRCAGGDVAVCGRILAMGPARSEHVARADELLADLLAEEPSALEAYEQLLREQLEAGAIVYSTPGEMRVGDRVTVTARITREELDALSDEIFEGMEEAGSGPLEVEDLQVGTSMRATLEGDGFAIQLIGPEEQMLRASGFREWRWRVEALRSGEWPLFLTVYATHDGRDIDTETLSREITVRVDPLRSLGGWWTRNWQWLVGMLFGSGVLAQWLRRRLLGSPPEGDEEDRASPRGPSRGSGGAHSTEPTHAAPADEQAGGARTREPAEGPSARP